MPGIPARARDRLAAVAIAMSIATGFASTASAAKRPPKPPSAQAAFTDALNSFDASRWAKADGWTNGTPFDNAWSAENVAFHDGLMELTLDDTARLGQPYTSGEYRSIGYYGYGCYEASVKPVAESGVVTTFFTFAGPYDNGGNGKHNEIDIEFLGQHLGGKPSYVQFNFWTNDDVYTSRNEYLQQLDFDAAAAFHVYAFRWSAAGIDWYVDGQLVYSAADMPGDPTPKATDSLQKVMMNLWPVDSSATAWAGEFAYPGAPLRAQYQWVRYSTLDDCQIGSTPDDPPPPPPPDDDASSMHLLGIAMSLASRNAQVIARASVVDGLGHPVVGASVTGTWSGVISSGDGERAADGNGIATFYSSRTRSPGNVEFCVTGISLLGMSYDASANTGSCNSITK